MRSRRLGVAVLLAVVASIVGSSAAGAQADPEDPCDPSRALRPRSYFVRSLPPVPGFRFTVDDQLITADSSGNALFTVLDTCDLVSRVRGNDELYALGEHERARLTRFYGGGGSVFTATFDVEYAVAFEFVTADGEVIDRDRLDSVSVRSSVGAVVDVPPGESRLWLQGERVVPLAEGLEIKDVYQTVDEVLVGGSNVVNRSQVKFFPDQLAGRPVTVPLLFYEARVQARDAFFGFSLGESVEIRFPDGTSQTHELESGRVTLPQLARGDYEMTVDGPGLQIARPVSMSRDQDVELKVISWLDLGVVVAGFALTVIGLAVVRRRRARRLGGGDVAAA